MAKIPGLGIFSGGLLLGKVARDGIISQRTHDIVNNRDPRQAIVQNVIDEVYSTCDMMRLAQERNTIHRDDVYRSIVQHWCREFDIRFNWYCTFHHAKRTGIGENPRDISNEEICLKIIEALDEYEKAQQKAQAEHHALPWYKKHSTAIIITCIVIFAIVMISLTVLIE